MIITTKLTLMIELTDSAKAATIIFNYGLCEMTRKGRIIRNIRSTLSAGISVFVSSISTIEVMTMKKSREFQESLRYEPSSIVKPSAMILRTISAMNK